VVLPYKAFIYLTCVSMTLFGLPPGDV